VFTAVQRAQLAHLWRKGLPSPWGTALAPAAAVYRGAMAVRSAAYAWGVCQSRRLPCRVLAVGNLAVGGTGKTPLVELIARRLTAAGRAVVILSRGYGRRRPTEVAAVSDQARVLLAAADAGDEPVLLARRLPGVPVVVGRDRLMAGEWALRRFAPDVLVLDDGFQQLRLRKDVEVVCLDARSPWGPGGLLPRGSLREPPASLGRADLIVLTHAHSPALASRALDEVRSWAPRAPVAFATHDLEGIVEVGSERSHPLDALRGRSVVGFAGIAVPEDFRATLRMIGADIREFVAFPDHHPYTGADLAGLEARAGLIGAVALVTTEKDAVRLVGAGSVGGRVPVFAVRVRLRLGDDDGAWWRVLEARLDAR
jgi:tetraacyldisaccharide 4'-kinase